MVLFLYKRPRASPSLNKARWLPGPFFVRTNGTTPAVRHLEKNAAVGLPTGYSLCGNADYRNDLFVINFIYSPGFRALCRAGLLKTEKTF